MVNSCHHQAICQLAPALKPMAYSDDGLVEAVYLPDKKYVIGYQWHPEMIYKKSLFSANNSPSCVSFNVFNSYQYK